MAILLVFSLLLLITNSIAFVANRPIHNNSPVKNPILLCRGTPSLLFSAPLPSQSEKDAEIDSVDPETLAAVLDVAIEAARKAGDIILGNAGGADVTERKANSRDLLTLIDPLCEQTIRTTILDRFPSHDFLGEEDVPPGKEASAAAIEEKLNKNNDENNWLWIVDPIDGTTNFVHGMPLNMPSIAAAYKGRVVAGVIYDPHRDGTKQIDHT